MAFCNRLHVAIAFVGADCPLCLQRHAPGGPIHVTSIDALKRELGLVETVDGVRFQRETSRHRATCPANLFPGKCTCPEGEL